MFYKLSEALKHVNSSNAVYAVDIKRKDNSIGKGFLVLKHDDLNDAIKQYGAHFYEILLPERATRIFVDIETTNGDYNTVKQGAECFIEMLKMFCSEYPYLLLDSSDDKKASFHIVGGPYMKNPFHVGALIRNITCYIQKASKGVDVIQNFNWQTLYDKDNNYIVDECIYTTNRQFRLAEMSKLGSSRILRGSSWQESILQNVHITDYKTCNEMDGIEPSSTSLRANEMFAEINDSWVRIAQCSRSKNVESLLPMSLSPVIMHLESIVGKDMIKGVRFDSKTLCYTLSYCKQCFIANRTHKSNHTWFILNPWDRSLHQKCFDDKCRRGKHSFEVPEHCWTKWKAMTQCYVDISLVSNSG